MKKIPIHGEPLQLLEQCITNSRKRKHPVDKERTIWEVF